MVWQYSGKNLNEVEGDFAKHDSSSGDPVTIDGEEYLIRAGHFVPYFKPASGSKGNNRARERLNLELCDRVFRISDARDVARSGEKADEAIDALMKDYENTDDAEHRRGVGRVLFGRIVSRIRDLSHDYLESRRESGDGDNTPEQEELIDKIGRLYKYVMVDNQDIFSAVRLYDLSKDEDGIIEEIFSEIGKTQQMPIDAIYANRVVKIGEAMKSIDEVTDIMKTTLDSIPMLPLNEMKDALDRYAETAQRLVGVPSSDHLAYDELASEYVDAHDAARDAILRIDHLNVMRGESHHLAEWLQSGINLIHSMQNIRDGRPNSVVTYTQAAERWTNPGRGVA